MDLQRRQVLGCIGTAASVAIAGCTGSPYEIESDDIDVITSNAVGESIKFTFSFEAVSDTTRFLVVSLNERRNIIAEEELTYETRPGNAYEKTEVVHRGDYVQIELLESD